MEQTHELDNLGMNPARLEREWVISIETPVAGIDPVLNALGEKIGLVQGAYDNCTFVTAAKRLSTSKQRQARMRRMTEAGLVLIHPRNPLYMPTLDSRTPTGCQYVNTSVHHHGSASTTWRKTTLRCTLRIVCCAVITRVCRCSTCPRGRSGIGMARMSLKNWSMRAFEPVRR